MAISTLPLTREIFQSGFIWRSYLDSMEEHGEVSRSLYEQAAVDPQFVKRFDSLVDHYGGALAASAMTEAWCGDSAVVLPIIARLAEGIPRMQFRVFIGKSHPKLRDAYRRDGFESIPLLSFFDANWREVGRWMERPKSADKRVKDWISARPRIAELRGREEPEVRAELKEIFRGLVPEMGEWYRAGLWNDTLTEIEALLRRGAPSVRTLRR